MNAHARAARILPHPTWAAICEGQRRKGLQKYKIGPEDVHESVAFWVAHTLEEQADETVYLLRAIDEGAGWKARLALRITTLAARLTLSIYKEVNRKKAR